MDVHVRPRTGRRLRAGTRAGDGEEALEIYKRLLPDLVASDLVMPEMDGQETLKAIRARDPNDMVIVISSLAMKEEVLKCVKAGASHYIVKPFKQDKVWETLTPCFPDLFPRENLGYAAY